MPGRHPGGIGAADGVAAALLLAFGTTVALVGLGGRIMVRRPMDH